MAQISKSKLGTFKTCPLKYKYQYIDKIEVEKAEQLTRGIDLHEIFCEFYNKFSVDDITDPERQFTEIFMPCKSDHKQDIMNFIKFEVKRWQSCSEKAIFKPLFRELKIVDTEAQITGIIDRVDFDGKNFILLDYKTGKYNASKLYEYRFELALYVYLLERYDSFKTKVNYWGIIFTNANVFWCEPVKREEIDKAIAKVEKYRALIAEAERTGEFKQSRSPLCQWCEYKERCMNALQ